MQLQLTRRTIIIIFLIAIVGAVFITYAGYFHDQSIKGIYTQLDPQIYSLQDKVANRNAQISNLEQQISTLQAQGNSNQQQISALQAQLAKLKAPTLDGIFTILGGGCNIYGCSAVVRGAWTNYGTMNASNVVVTLTWSEAGCCPAAGGIPKYFVQNNTIYLGVVPGQSISLYPDTSYTLAHGADHLDWSFTWTN